MLKTVFSNRATSFLFPSSLFSRNLFTRKVSLRSIRALFLSLVIRPVRGGSWVIPNATLTIQYRSQLTRQPWRKRDSLCVSSAGLSEKATSAWRTSRQNPLRFWHNKIRPHARLLFSEAFPSAGPRTSCFTALGMVAAYSDLAARVRRPFPNGLDRLSTQSSGS